MIAALNESTVKPWMICPTNQKNAPLITRENNPKVRMLSGKVKIVMIGLTTIFRNTKQAETMTAVKILLTPIPETKYGKAKIARTVINHLSNIMRLLYYKYIRQIILLLFFSQVPRLLGHLLLS